MTQPRVSFRIRRRQLVIGWFHGDISEFLKMLRAKGILSNCSSRSRGKKTEVTITLKTSLSGIDGLRLLAQEIAQCRERGHNHRLILEAWKDLPDYPMHRCPDRIDLAIELIGSALLAHAKLPAASVA